METHKTTMYLVPSLDEAVEEDELDAAEAVAEAATAWFVATATELDEDDVAISCATEELVGATTTDEVRAVEVGSVAEVVGSATTEEVVVLDGETEDPTPELLWTHAALTEATTATRAMNCLGANIL